MKIEQIAKLSRISLSDAERLFKDIEGIISKANRFGDLPVDDISNLSIRETYTESALREDVVTEAADFIEFSNAPHVKDGCIVIPKIKGV